MSAEEFVDMTDENRAAERDMERLLPRLDKRKGMHLALSDTSMRFMRMWQEHSREVFPYQNVTRRASLTDWNIDATVLFSTSPLVPGGQPTPRVELLHLDVMDEVREKGHATLTIARLLRQSQKEEVSFFVRRVPKGNKVNDICLRVEMDLLETENGYTTYCVLAKTEQPQT